LAV
jgi:hypothetical protein